jgi:hypothetical protein
MAVDKARNLLRVGEVADAGVASIIQSLLWYIYQLEADIRAVELAISRATNRKRPDAPR